MRMDALYDVTDAKPVIPETDRALDTFERCMPKQEGLVTLPLPEPFQLTSAFSDGNTTIWCLRFSLTRKYTQLRSR